jgi:DNA-binding NarL/FixJ family response regulator
VEVPALAEALKAALRIKAAIKCQKDLDVRMAIGIGHMAHAAPAITERNGEAFVNSGTRFDQMKEEKRRLAIRSPWPEMDNEMDLYLRLASLFMDQWTPLSAEVVAILLEEPGLKQAMIAKRLGISQSSVSDRLSRARWDELQALDAMYRHKLKIHLV